MITWVSSNETGCQYSQGMQVEPQNVLMRLKNSYIIFGNTKTQTVFSGVERVALDFSLAASMLLNTADAGIKEELYKYWNEGEILEILGVISLLGYLNR